MAAHDVLWDTPAGAEADHSVIAPPDPKPAPEPSTEPAPSTQPESSTQPKPSSKRAQKAATKAAAAKAAAAKSAAKAAAHSSTVKTTERRITTVELSGDWYGERFGDKYKFLQEIGAGSIIRAHLQIPGGRTRADLEAHPELSPLLKKYDAFSLTEQKALVNEYPRALFWQAIHFLGKSFGFLNNVMEIVQGAKSPLTDYCRGYFYVCMDHMAQEYAKVGIEQLPSTVPQEDNVHLGGDKLKKATQTQFAGSLRLFDTGLSSVMSAFIVRAKIMGADEAASLLNMFYQFFMSVFKDHVEQHGMKTTIVTRSKKQELEFEDAHGQVNHNYKIQACEVCSGYGHELKRCARCKQAHYCSVLCQRAHWSVHKLECKKEPAEAPRVEEIEDKPEKEAPEPVVVLPDGRINIGGLDKMALLFALWDNTTATGELVNCVTEWDPHQAVRELYVSTDIAGDHDGYDTLDLYHILDRAGYINVQHLCGRPINTTFYNGSSAVSPTRYDAHAGAGTFERVVRELRGKPQVGHVTPMRVKTKVEAPENILKMSGTAAKAGEYVKKVHENDGIPTRPAEGLETSFATLSSRLKDRFSKPATPEDPPAASEAADEAKAADEMLTFVDADKARALELECTEKYPGLQHYWEKAAVYVIEQKGRAFPMDAFDEEFAKWEDHYFSGQPAMMRAQTRLSAPCRHMDFLWFTK